MKNLNKALAYASITAITLTYQNANAANAINQTTVINNPSNGTYSGGSAGWSSAGTISSGNTLTVNNGYTWIIEGGNDSLAENNTLYLNNTRNTWRAMGSVGSRLTGNRIIVKNSSLFDVFGGELKV